jgi:hypothetical protein
VEIKRPLKIKCLISIMMSLQAISINQIKESKMISSAMLQQNQKSQNKTFNSIPWISQGRSLICKILMSSKECMIKKMWATIIILKWSDTKAMKECWIMTRFFIRREITNVWNSYKRFICLELMWILIVTRKWRRPLGVKILIESNKNDIFYFN